MIAGVIAIRKESDYDPELIIDSLIDILTNIDESSIITLDDTGCLCTTMFRITPQHLAWALENLAQGNVVNRIQVRAEVKQWAKVALDRMLELGCPSYVRLA